jgi:hypothetical protein
MGPVVAAVQRLKFHPVDKNRNIYTSTRSVLQLGDQELASGDWRESEVLFPL